MKNSVNSYTFPSTGGVFALAGTSGREINSGVSATMNGNEISIEIDTISSPFTLTSPSTANIGWICPIINNTTTTITVIPNSGCTLNYGSSSSVVIPQLTYATITYNGGSNYNIGSCSSMYSLISGITASTGYIGILTGGTGYFSNLSATNFSFSGSETFMNLVTANGGITASTGYFTSGIISSMTGGILMTVKPSPNYIYVVEQFGAKVDGIVLQGGSINVSSATLNCSNATWTSADIGKQISVSLAGTSGLVLCSTISGYNSATQITLTNSASTTTSGTSQIVYGTDDTPAWRNAMSSLE